MNDFKITSELVFSLNISRKEYANILHISSSSLYRYLKEPQKVSNKCQNRSAVIYNVLNRGISTFGDQQKFGRWLYKNYMSLG